MPANSPYIMKKGISSVLDLKDGLAALGLGIGNVYYVCQAANTVVYAHLLANVQGQYSDGSYKVHTTIQSALDATVACRNDYVMVMPDSSDYDLTTALTLTKKAVHLIGPGLVSGVPGATNAARIDQTGAYAVMTISGNAVEVAGFFFKGKADKTVIEISAAAHCCDIHHNFVGMRTTAGAADAYGIHGTGESTNLMIHDNFVTVYEPTASVTVGGAIVLANGTRAQIVGNYINTGGFAQTMSIGISPGTGALSLIAFNILNESDSGTPGSSVFTKGITLNSGSIAVYNQFAMTTKGNALTGGAANMAAVENFDSTTGGELRTLDA